MTKQFIVRGMCVFCHHIRLLTTCPVCGKKYCKECEIIHDEEHIKYRHRKKYKKFKRRFNNKRIEIPNLNTDEGIKMIRNMSRREIINVIREINKRWERKRDRK